MKRKIYTFLGCVWILICNACYTFASTIEEVLGNEAGSPREVDGSFAGKFIGAFRWIGYAIAVGMLVVIGIKYVTAAPDEKADLKKSLVRYAIGAVLIVGAVTIAHIIFNGV